MKVMVIGGGGREHCLVWKISQSPLVDKVYCAPGNGGTASISENVNISPTDINGLMKFAEEENIDLTIVGPEAPLVAGIVDAFKSRDLKIFGPDKEAAMLEGSKVFAKEMMRKFGVPTADFKVFDNPEEAKEYIKKRGAPVVVKADGLAAGKGVVVADSVDQACEAVDTIMVKRKFSDAGNRVVVEECLSGEEASILALVDGETFLTLVSSQDHKPIFEGDKGPNTGGMGAYSPAPLVTDEVFDKIKTEVFSPLIAGMNREGKVFKGILYAGLMIKDGQPYVLEFNVRFGDPETQAILPKLKSDTVEGMLAVTDGTLGKFNFSWDERFCICVVLASGGYPGVYEKGKVISGIDEASKMEDVFIFHAGTKREKRPEGETFVTSGGRVLNVVALADSIEEAQRKVYAAVEKIHFDKMYYRRDIGSKALKFLSRDVK